MKKERPSCFAVLCSGLGALATVLAFVALIYFVLGAIIFGVLTLTTDLDIISRLVFAYVGSGLVLGALEAVNCLPGSRDRATRRKGRLETPDGPQTQHGPATLATKVVALIGMVLLIIPLLLNVVIHLNTSRTNAEFVATLSAHTLGMVLGFLGLLFLAYVVDAKGCRKPSILVPMAIIGVLWRVFLPSGWILGVPIVLYTLLKRLGYPLPPPAPTTEKESIPL
jgi:hypothetical protein